MTTPDSTPSDDEPQVQAFASAERIAGMWCSIITITGDTWLPTQIIGDGGDDEAETLEIARRKLAELQPTIDYTNAFMRLGKQPQ